MLRQSNMLHNQLARKTAILGSSGLVAPYVFSKLATTKQTADVISRQNPDLPHGFAHIPTDDLQQRHVNLSQYDTIIGLWPIWLTADIVSTLGSRQHLIALSSTSIHGKATSRVPAERELAKRLANAELKIDISARQSGFRYTILRPTIIYDGQHDNSVCQIAAVIRRLGFFPVAGRAVGLRQPIHVCDVADAILRSMATPTKANQLFDLTGGETLTYRSMVERIAVSMGRKSRVIGVPSFGLRWLIALMQTVRFTRQSPGLVDRMNEDLAYDGSEACRQLSIQPRPFFPTLLPLHSIRTAEIDPIHAPQHGRP
ncbi:MAG: hypothetical protein ACR2OV_09570 [Hyphomicrobiaceae bacterium]